MTSCASRVIGRDLGLCSSWQETGRRKRERERESDDILYYRYTRALARYLVGNVDDSPAPAAAGRQGSY